MKPPSSNPTRAVLARSLRTAGEIALRHFRSARAAAKPDGTEVTVADREVEDYLVEALVRDFPGTGVVSEEGTEIAGGAERWYVDPIDGTSAYLQGLAHWGPTVCLVRDDEILLGALWMPRLQEFWWAEKGGGAWRDDTRLAPADRAVGRHDALFAPSRFHRRMPFRWPGKIRALGSSAAHLALVAAGGGVATVIPKWKLWDVGCGALLMHEAGRMICDVQGEPVNVTTCRPGLPILAGASTALHLLTVDGWAERALG